MLVSNEFIKRILDTNIISKDSKFLINNLIGLLKSIEEDYIFVKILNNKLHNFFDNNNFIYSYSFNNVVRPSLYGEILKNIDTRKFSKIDDINLYIHNVIKKSIAKVKFNNVNKFTIVKNNYKDIKNCVKDFNYLFITDDVIKDLKTQSLNFKHSVNCEHFNIIFYKKSKFSYNNKINKYIILTSIAYNLISTFSRIFFSYKSDLFTIDLLLSNAKKKFHKYNFFDKKNINSAQFNSYNNFLSIFRSEEFFKLMVHEMMHCFRLEKNFKHNFKSINSLINKSFSIKKYNEHILSNFLISESVAEFFAIVFNTYLLSWIIKNKFNFNCHFLFIFHQILNLEIIFSLFQISKILYLSKFDSYKNFLRKNNNTKNSIYTNTNTFEYHFIKVIFLIYNDDFLNFYFNKKNINKSFLSKLFDSFNNSPFTYIIDLFIRYLYSNFDFDNFFFSTSRMSLFDFNI